MWPAWSRRRFLRRSTTIQDIGRELGLSAMTVSRALNGHPDVKKETRDRVLSQAAKLKYRPNRWARSLVTKRSQIVGVVIPDISHSFFSEITRGVQDKIEQCGYDLMLCHSHGDAKRERVEIEMLLGSRVDGLIVASEQAENSPGIFVDLLREKIPFVLLDRFFSGLACPSVRADDFAAGRIATEHLISLGHRAIAHIGVTRVSTGRLRMEGYLDALRRRQISPRDEWIITGEQLTISGGYGSMRGLMALKDQPTALFAANDPIAIGAIQACREAGLDVPGDLSIVGAGCIENSMYPTPFLTTVDWPRRELGEKAAELLLELIDGKRQPKRTEWIYDPALLVRKSTAPLRS